MRAFKVFLVGLSALCWTGAFLPALMITGVPDLAFAAPEDAPAAAPAAPAAPDINVTVDAGGDKRVVWFANPMILAAAGVGLIVVIAIIALASRGNGTTIIREK